MSFGPKPVDIRGVRFGRLVALEYHDHVGRSPRWRCVCDCGRERVVFKNALTTKKTKSCGCWQRESASLTTGREKTTHGGRRTPEYSVFCGIKRRCNNQNDKSYRRYGALGVRCLYKDFPQFLRDVGERPSPRHSIDRIDTHGDYRPKNCRWALPAVQARNKKAAIIVTFRGEQRPLADWCDDLGLNYKSTWQRIRKYGWPAERALAC